MTVAVVNVLHKFVSLEDNEINKVLAPAVFIAKLSIRFDANRNVYYTQNSLH